MQKEESSEKEMSETEAWIGLLIALPASILLRAYTLSTLWYWFVVPIGFRGIGMAHALGLVTVISLFRFNENVKPVLHNDAGTLNYYFRSIIVSGACLLMGTIYYILM